MKVGRPKKILDDLPNGWKESILSKAREGGSDVQARNILGISNDLWYRLIKEEPEFSETIKQAKDLCQEWWEKKGMEMLDSGDNATIWIFNMKNRFGWTDKREIDNKSSDGSMTPPQVIEIVAKDQSTD